MSETNKEKATPFKLGIIIPHWQKSIKNLRQLERCLMAIKKHEPYLLQHTFVMDDCSPWGLLELNALAQQYRVGIEYKGEKGSYSDSINRGAHVLIKHKYTHMLTLNNDVEVTTRFRKMVQESFELNPRITVIGGLLLYQNGRVQSASFEVHKIHTNFIIKESDKGLYGLVAGSEHLTPRFVHGVTGAMQFIDLKTFAAMGQYSMCYPLGFEDVEFCLRTWLRGGWVYYNPHIQGIHCESATRGKFPGVYEAHSYRQLEKDVGAMDFGTIAARMNVANSLQGGDQNGRYQEHERSSEVSNPGLQSL